MRYFEDAQARQEVEQLHRLAMDANDEGQYATKECLLQQAVVIARRLDDLPLLVKERYWLAAAQRAFFLVSKTKLEYTYQYCYNF